MFRFDPSSLRLLRLLGVVLKHSTFHVELPSDDGKPAINGQMSDEPAENGNSYLIV
jgi:hypothetical protein